MVFLCSRFLDLIGKIYISFFIKVNSIMLLVTTNRAGKKRLNRICNLFTFFIKKIYIDMFAFLVNVIYIIYE